MSIVTFFRVSKSGQFTKDERTLFDSALPLLANLIVFHFTILRLQGNDDAENDSSARSLIPSMSSYKVTPFDNLTGRVYEKIAIATQNELFPCVSPH